MNIEGLRQVLKDVGIDESRLQIKPPFCAEGALCLEHEAGQGWRVIYVDRGEYITNEFFSAEHDACRFFLKKALCNPTNRVNFKQENLDEFFYVLPDLLKKYGFESDLP